MAKRPIFIPKSCNSQIWSEVEIEFKFYNGFALTQKSKSIKSFHEAAARLGYEKILEVSTKSSEKIGWELSAFNLTVELDEGRDISLESAFQGSKIFEGGTRYEDIYDAEPIEAKKDQRLKNSGKIVGFEWKGERWSSEPKTAFYDWLYIHAIFRNETLLESLLNYDAFTDIEFNPKKSINCQARSCAILVSLFRKKKLKKALSSKEEFINLVYKKSYTTATLF